MERFETNRGKREGLSQLETSGCPLLDERKVRRPPDGFRQRFPLRARQASESSQPPYVIQNSPIFRWYLNTILVSAVITVVSISCALTCAYALSRLEFKGKALINLALLIGFMLPFGAMAIPLFMLMNKLHLVNSYAGIILPQIATPLSVIVFKRFFDQVPTDFRDAAVIDGARDFRILLSIYIPLNWSIIWSMAIVTFIGAWNNFFWPFIVTNSTPMLTIPVGMTQVQSAYGVAFAKTSAIAVLASIPTAVGYLIFQKRVTQGVMASAGIK
jgi:multiple sugar transport system permease protein